MEDSEEGETVPRQTPHHRRHVHGHYDDAFRRRELQSFGGWSSRLATIAWRVVRSWNVTRHYDSQFVVLCPLQTVSYPRCRYRVFNGHVFGTHQCHPSERQRIHLLSSPSLLQLSDTQSHSISWLSPLSLYLAKYACWRFKS